MLWGRQSASLSGLTILFAFYIHVNNILLQVAGPIPWKWGILNSFWVNLIVKRSLPRSGVGHSEMTKKELFTCPFPKSTVRVVVQGYCFWPVDPITTVFFFFKGIPVPNVLSFCNRHIGLFLKSSGQVFFLPGLDSLLPRYPVYLFLGLFLSLCSPTTAAKILLKFLSYTFSASLTKSCKAMEVLLVPVTFLMSEAACLIKAIATAACCPSEVRSKGVYCL